MATRQTFTGRYNMASTATEYISPTILRRGGASVAEIEQPWMATGRARALRVQLAASPGLGKSRTFTFLVNGADTLLTCTLSDAEEVAAIEIDVALVIRDLIVLRHTCTAGTPLAEATLTVVIDHTEAAISCYGGTNGGEVITGAVNYGSSILTAGWSVVAGIANRTLMPTDGVIAIMRVELDAAPGMGNTLTFDLVVDGVSQSIGLVVANTDTSGEVTCNVGFAAGQYVQGIATRAGGSNNINVKAGYRFEMARDGEMIVAPSSGPTNHSGATYYYPPNNILVGGESLVETDVAVFATVSNLHIRNFYAGVVQSLIAPGTGPLTFALRKNFADAMVVEVSATGMLGGPNYGVPDTTSSVLITPLDVYDVAITWTTSVPGGTTLHWSFIQYQLATPIPGVIGPLVWLHWRRRLPNGEVVTDTYSDHDMQCPASWENGFKEGIVLEFGDGSRQASHPVTGDIVGSTFTVTLSDHRRRFREQLSSLLDRYWNGPHTVRMTTRANRAALGSAYTAFVGNIVDAQPRGPLAWELTLGDLVTDLLLSDQAQLPWRQIRDSGILPALDLVSDTLDLETPEPIIYGEHRRVPDVSPASPQGFIYEPTYLGIQTLGFPGSPGQNQWYVWLVAGHALKFIPDVYTVDNSDPTIPPVVTSVLADEGVAWLIPHYGGWNALHSGNPYVDFRSPTTGADQRYTLIYGKVGSTDPERVISGQVQLAVAIMGIEDVGDSTGSLITDRLLQYEHFFINYVANAGPASYQAGNWLDNPTWSFFDSSVPICDTDSFEQASAIAAGRLPSPGSPTVAGYIGAAIIGAHAGDRATARRWLADWNRSCGVRSAWTHFGQYRVGMLHPTAAIKAAAPLYTDSWEMLRDSFGTTVRWDQHANRIPFRADHEHTSGQWKTTGLADAGTSLANYNRSIVGEMRDYPFAPGITHAYHLARIESLMYQDPPRCPAFEATVGPDNNGDSLGNLDVFDYVRYKSFQGINDDRGEIRLAWLTYHQVQSGKRRVRVELLDCEDLIDFDAPSIDLSTGSPGAEACVTAQEMGPLDWVTQADGHDQAVVEFDIDTSTNGTDETTDFGSPSLLGDGYTAYHAAWFKLTGNVFDCTGSFSTLGSNYDTVMWLFGGSCGSLFPVAFNDNFAATPQAAFDTPIIGGTDYFVLVAGFGPADAGHLHLRIVFDQPPPP